MTRPNFDQMLPLGATSGVGTVPDGPLPAPDWLKSSIETDTSPQLSERLIELSVPAEEAAERWQGIEGVLRLAGNAPLLVAFEPVDRVTSCLRVQTTLEQLDRLDLDGLKALLENEA